MYINIDVCFLQRAVNGQLRCNELFERILLSVRHCYFGQLIVKLFYTPVCRTNLGLQSPLTRICNREVIKNNHLDIFHTSLVGLKSGLLPGCNSVTVCRNQLGT